MKNTIDRQTAFLMGGLYFITAILFQSQGWLVGVWMFVSLFLGTLLAFIAHKTGRKWEAVFYFSLLLSLVGGIIAFFIAKKAPVLQVASAHPQRPVFMDPIEEMEYNERMSKPLPPPPGWKNQTLD